MSLSVSGSSTTSGGHENSNDTDAHQQVCFDRSEEGSRRQTAPPHQHYPNIYGQAISQNRFNPGSSNWTGVRDQNAQYLTPVQLNNTYLSTEFRNTATSQGDIVFTHDSNPFTPVLSPETLLDEQRRSTLHSESKRHFRYQCLDPLLPYLHGILPTSVAHSLFDVYLVDPGTFLFRRASPYILTRVFRKKSLFHPTRPRSISTALLAAILCCCVQTADTPSLHIPGARSKIARELYRLASSLICKQEKDRLRAKNCKTLLDSCRGLANRIS